jgi:DNA primase
MYCHAGCTFGEITAALAIMPADVQGSGRASAPAAKPDPDPVDDSVIERLGELQSAFSQSFGEKYLVSRGIGAESAIRYGAGYAEQGKWPHYCDRDGGSYAVRQWRSGRVVFPHTRPDGVIVNLYGRAADPHAAKRARHDHLPGSRGMFNARAIAAAKASGEPLYLVEGPFDALSLLELGARHVVGLYGVNGVQWRWLAGVCHLVIGFDRDPAGREQSEKVQRRAQDEAGILYSQRIPAEAYGKGKDLNEALLNGALERWWRSV